MANYFVEEEPGEAERDPGPVTMVGVRMRPGLRRKLEALAEAEGRMITAGAMVRLLIRRAEEPRKRKRQL